MSEYIIDMSNSSYQSTSGLLCADVSQLREEIVRCRDCAYYEDYIGRCVRRYHPMAVTPDGFCKWGERKGDGQTE